MKYRMLPLFLVAAALAAFSTHLQAEDKANTHEGTFVMAKGDKEFVMEDKGKEHTHTLTPDAKLIGIDGKDAKLSDFKKGQKIKVTTKEGDKTIATRLEAVKPVKP